MDEILEPRVWRNILDWPQAGWTLDQWEENLSTFEEVFPFRQGSFHCSVEPEWEKDCPEKEMSIKEFFTLMKTDAQQLKNWFYFDYKHLHQWFQNSPAFKEVNWGKMGYPERDRHQTTLWMGTRGAHTPMHYDTYGFNIVAQLYGRKEWVLVPPSQTDLMEPSRIPYEESTVYSRINFACACSLKQRGLSGVDGARVVSLEAGDVLLVPPLWWHFVMNTSPAISVNTWIERPGDREKRLEEAIVKCWLRAVSNRLSSREEEVEEESDLNEMLTQSLGECCQVRDSLEVRQVKVPAGSSPCPPLRPPSLLSNLLSSRCLGDTPSLPPPPPSPLPKVLQLFSHPDVITLVRTKLQADYK